MPSHQERQLLPYTCEQLFNLVADVEKYPEFLPWCRAARIHERGDNYLIVELVIHFKHITEQYTSRVELTPHSAIDVTMTKGPFEHLTNTWRFEPLPDGGTSIDFHLDFAFRSKMLEKVIGLLFGSATEKMVDAFHTRADALYGGATD